MPRSTLVSMRFVLALALMASCGGSTLGPGGGMGGSSAGAGGGTAGTGGGGAGAGGAGGAPVTNCPTVRPPSGACAGSFFCNYTDAFNCGVACYSTYMCSNGRFIFMGNNDGCFQVTCSPDAGTDAADAATAAVCTFGMDQTCNDSPDWAAIYGRCTDAGTCVCGDAGASLTTGRCLTPTP